MTEQRTPFSQGPTTSAPSPLPARKNGKKHLKGIITLLFCWPFWPGGGYLLWRFVLQPSSGAGRDLSVPASIGTIQVWVQGQRQ